MSKLVRPEMANVADLVSKFPRAMSAQVVCETNLLDYYCTQKAWVRKDVHVSPHRCTHQSSPSFIWLNEKLPRLEEGLDAVSEDRLKVQGQRKKKFLDRLRRREDADGC
ncbi:hypothetical protein EVAR_37999_1 [Eumeta japonica]|uniref:Uncharacterized protein n=1 Tax=Eumeta variegata TaxID=151549 RepID=A0A4C1WYC9_EUMVA|nr:hypothetical protein EVAR_37999_1 [Eumeta japonica]